MGKKLVIVESGAKATTIEKMLGKDFVVRSCKGHVMDLPKSKLGIDTENDFEPSYDSSEAQEKVLQELKKLAKKSDTIYLATDPDREGEAIGKHLYDVLSNGAEIRRITFNEITKSAVREAVANPREIDMDLVNAQTARRVLDRLVGYKISPILWRKVTRGLSAGRVQSVAVRLVVEREEAIEAFVPEEYWTLDAMFEGKAKVSFPAQLSAITDEDGKQIKCRTSAKSGKFNISTTEEAEAIRKQILEATYAITKINRREKKRNPKPPFITSSLQAMANRRFGYNGKRTMVIAQQLYEGRDLDGERVGLITYMRTDSTRTADSALDEARTLITDDYGKEYLPTKARIFKSRKGAQDAHEAIRPTSLARTPKSIKKYLTPDQFKLYDLIYRRFLASQMKEAIFDTTEVLIGGGRFEFKAKGSTMKFDGYLKLFPEDIEDDVILPKLEDDEPLDLIEITPNQHFTKPPARFNDASLIKTLEELGIGRPSTYAPIVATILARRYVERITKAFHPTELGRLVNALLVVAFPNVLDANFTAQVESDLDSVEDGKRRWQDIIGEFYNPFSESLETASDKMDEFRDSKNEETDLICEKCGGKMLIKWGRFGKYLGCENSRTCKNTHNFTHDEDGNVVIEKEPETDEVCEKCGAPMVVKNGRYGKFFACSKYPECKTTKAIKKTVDAKCPLCGGDIVERRAKARGNIFYGCDNYPECKFAAPDIPLPEPCPECDNKYLLNGKNGPYCHNKECGFGKKKKPKKNAEKAGAAK